MSNIPDTKVPGDFGQNSDFNLTDISREFLSEQTMTPIPATLVVAIVRGRDNSHFSFSVHWTVRTKVTTMTDRTASILLKVLVFDQLLNGIDFTGYLSIEYLVARLMRGYLDPLDIREEKDRQAAMLGTLILASVRGTWINVQDRLKLPPSIIQDIAATGWLPDRRTLMSWKQYHKPRTFLEVLTVPLETYNEREHLGIRYSSYCKGYGNGGHLSRTKKTRYDSELDGESTDRDSPDFNLLEVEQYCQLLLSIEREKIQRANERE
jgi:hypothetical protein